MIEGWPGMRAYASETPHYFGQFPALSYAIYKGHIKEGDIAAARRLAVDDIFTGVDALSQDFTGGGYDRKEVTGNLATPTETLAIGRVTVKIGDGQEAAAKTDWPKYWDKSAKTVKSNTGELFWDYGQRVVVVTADKTHAIIGFPGDEVHDLPGLSARIKTEFVSLIFTALDDEALIESKHILVTAMARDKQFGSRYSDDGSKLLHAGSPPLMLEPVEASIILKGGAIKSIRAVDIYGVPTDRELTHDDNQFVIDGRYGCYYYEIRR